MAKIPIGGYDFSETIGIDLANSRGTPVVSSSTAKGSYTEIAAETKEDTEFFSVSFCYDPTGSAMRDFVFDIAVGALGEEINIVTNYATQAKQSFTPVFSVPFRIKIPKGSRVTIRMRTNIAITTAYFSMRLYTGNPDSPGAFSQSFGYGVSFSGSSKASGVAVDAGPTANTRGAWFEIIAETPETIKEFVVCIGGDSNVTHTAGSFLYSVAVGPLDDEVVILENVEMTTSSFEVLRIPELVQREIPQGERVSIAMQSTITDATDRIQSFSIQASS